MSDYEEMIKAAFAAEFAAGRASRDAEVEALTLALQTERAAANRFAKDTVHWIEKHDKLLAEVEALKTELREGDDLRTRLSLLLTRSVNAIRGEPEPLHLHSWHDLPELVEALRADALRLDWLSNNFYSRENLDWITGKVSDKNNMWVFFAPIGHQGNIRTVLDAAMSAQEK